MTVIFGLCEANECVFSYAKRLDQREIMMKRFACTTLVLFALLMSGTHPGLAQKPLFSAADTQELLSFRLTDDMVEHYRSATMAFTAWGKAHPKDIDRDDDDNKGSDATISDMVAHFNKHPQFEALMRSNGITPRQYIDTMFVLTSGLVMVDMQKEGQAIKPSPILSTANLDYIRKNHDRLEKITKEMGEASQ
jgi:hypothetical protein